MTALISHPYRWDRRDALSLMTGASVAAAKLSVEQLKPQELVGDL